ncbi:hypothetical protein BGZ58_000257 [Dissophora ornata]|nr:hypothetical protein BGZ58_000257 [Dissophora ornata]
MTQSYHGSVPDNQLILQRAADSCRALDDLRYRLHSIQKRLANTRKQPLSSTAPSISTDASATPIARDEVLTQLLHEAYVLQFQISTLLAATEEPIPERERIPKLTKSQRKRTAA